MKFERRFVKTPGQPYEGIRFEDRTSELKNSDGSKASSSLKVTVPDSWSQVAADIMAQKYLRKAGISRVKFREMAHRGELPGITKSSW